MATKDQSHPAYSVSLQALKSALQSAGLDTCGKKQDLVQRVIANNITFGAPPVGEPKKVVAKESIGEPLTGESKEKADKEDKDKTEVKPPTKKAPAKKVVKTEDDEVSTTDKSGEATAAPTPSNEKVEAKPPAKKVDAKKVINTEDTPQAAVQTKKAPAKKLATKTQAAAPITSSPANEKEKGGEEKKGEQKDGDTKQEGTKEGTDVDDSGEKPSGKKETEDVARPPPSKFIHIITNDGVVLGAFTTLKNCKDGLRKLYPGVPLKTLIDGKHEKVKYTQTKANELV